MVKYDFLTPENLRMDGRKPHEVRPLVYQSGEIVAGADGSASVSMGLTKAVASVYGPRPFGKKQQTVTSAAVVAVEYRTATFSSIDRRRRSKGDRQSQERALWLQKVFEHAILVEQYPRSQIEILVEVLQQDGSPVSACINAVTLALVNAGIPLRDMVTSCTLGLMDTKTVLVDLNNSEQENGAGSAQIILATHPRSGKVCLCEVEAKVSVGAFEEACRLGTASCLEIAQGMRQHVLEYADERLCSLENQGS